MVRAIAGLAVCVSGAVCGQSTVAQRFEVASVKPSKADPGSSSGIKTGRGRLDARNVTLKRCIMGAYGVGPHQIFGGPDWLESDRFEILARAEQPIDDDAALCTSASSYDDQFREPRLQRADERQTVFLRDLDGATLSTEP